MTAIVVNKTPEQASRELTELLHEVGMDAHELRDRADNYLLTPVQHTAWRRVEALLWLLEENRARLTEL